jgi:hypothetical protein
MKRDPPIETNSQAVARFRAQAMCALPVTLAPKGMKR